MHPPANKLFNKDFLLVWQGQTISQLGNQAFNIAMLFWTMEATGSASLMGLLMMATALPAAVLAPLGGALADRMPRIRIAVFCDTVAGLVVLAVAWLVTSELAVASKVGGLFVAAAVLGTVLAFLTPALTAVVPDLVPKAQLPKANALNQLAVQTSVFTGQAVGGVLFRLLGAPVLFVIDGVSFLVAAVSESFAREPHPPQRLKLDWQATLGAFVRDLKEGLRYARSQPGLLGFMSAAASFNFFSMPIVVLLPFFVRDYLQATTDWYGYLMAAISLGAVLGFVTASLVPFQGRARSRFVVGLMLAAPFGLAALGFLRSPVLALALGVGIGMLTGAINIFVMTTLQTTTPTAMRGRMMGLLAAMTGSMSPLGMALGGLLGDLTGKNVPAIALGCGAMALLLTILIVSRRSTRDFLAYE